MISMEARGNDMDDKRKQFNAQRVQKMHVLMRPNILAIIADMEGAGWQPRIDVGVYRTPAEQARKVAQGYSKTYFSYHNVTGADGTPESEAADIVDVRYQWNPPEKYWLQLAAAAENQGLETGIYWGLSQTKRNAIHTAIGDKDWDASLSTGWDSAHCQAPQSKFTISEAKSGHRYNPGAPKPPILTVPKPNQTTYKLIGGNGKLMDTLNVFDGASYVSARKWGSWFGFNVSWDAANRKVLFNGIVVASDVKIIAGEGFLPIRAAAEATGLGLEVDNAQRTITLSR